MLLALAVLAFAIAAALAAHHACIHSAQPPADGIPSMCLLQPDDVCAYRCTHETWIALCVVVGVTLTICSLLLDAAVVP